jgi:hypothetical protein
MQRKRVSNHPFLLCVTLLVHNRKSSNLAYIKGFQGFVTLKQIFATKNHSYPQTTPLPSRIFRICQGEIHELGQKFFLSLPLTW